MVEDVEVHVFTMARWVLSLLLGALFLQNVVVCHEAPLCTGPYTVLEITNIITDESASEPSKVTGVTITFKRPTSPTGRWHSMAADAWLGAAPIPPKGPGEITATKVSDTTTFNLVIKSKKPFDAAELSLGVVTEYPCNSVVMRATYPTLRDMFTEGVPFPRVAVMPIQGYSMEKSTKFNLTFGVHYTHEDERVLRLNRSDRRKVYQPYYYWKNKTGAYLVKESYGMPPWQRMSSVRYSQRSSYSSYSPNATTTTTMQGRLPRNLPLDGVVLSAAAHFSFKETQDFYIYTYTSFHFTDPYYNLIPMGVSSMNKGFKGDGPGFRYFSYGRHGHYFDIVTLSFDESVPKSQRGLSCFAVGGYVTVSKLTSLKQVWSSSFVQLKDVPTEITSEWVRIGPIAFAEFFVDVPAGGEAYYYCDASRPVGRGRGRGSRKIGFRPLIIKVLGGAVDVDRLVLESLAKQIAWGG